VGEPEYEQEPHAAAPWRLKRETAPNGEGGGVHSRCGDVDGRNDGKQVTTSMALRVAKTSNHAAKRRAPSPTNGRGPSGGASARS